MRLIFFLLSFFILISCKPELENKTQEVLYFDVKKLIAKQAGLLDSANARVQKFIRHDKQRENARVKINWQQELKIFEEANLNRPIYKDLYSQTDSIVQHTTYRVFTAKQNNLQVKYMRLVYENKQLKTLDANLVIQNILYHSEKQLRLSFKSNGTLAGYAVKGNFATVYGTKYDYEIDAVVVK